MQNCKNGNEILEDFRRIWDYWDSLKQKPERKTKLTILVFCDIRHHSIIYAPKYSNH